VTRALPVFVVISHWRLHAEHEQAFVQAWTRVTIRLRDERERSALDCTVEPTDSGVRQLSR
jgi:hypothetical protein